MIAGTHAYKVLRSVSPEKMRYDQYVKEFVADIQILARIVQHTVAEFGGLDIDEIIESIDAESIEVGETPVEPGLTNYGKLQGELTENIVLNEGIIFFDVRFSLKKNHTQFKIIINIEAQKSTDPKRLGYHIENRIVYYLSRLISSQKEVEFFHSDYDSIKKVYSIWICMDAEDEKDSITQISLAEKALYGAPQNFEQLDKMCGIVVHIRENSDVQESKNKLIAMLEDVFSKEDCETKKKNLQDKHGIRMTIELEGRMDDVCNLSDVVEERGIKAGLEKGMAQGMAQGMVQGQEKAEMQMAIKLFKSGVSYEVVKNSVETLLEEELLNIYEEAMNIS